MAEREGSVERKVFIIDDHAIVRRGLRELFEREPDLAVCGEASTATDALLGLREIRPDLVIADLMLEGRSGLELIRKLGAAHSGPQVLVVSLFEEYVYVRHCLDAGARGYVSLHLPTAELLKAAREVLNGRTYVPEAHDWDRQRSVDSSDPVSNPSDHVIAQLTDRELEVFLLLGRGYVPRHIAERLNLSVSTVEVYRQRLKQKLQIESSPMLLRFAVRWCKHHDAP